ncbi:unnamed protein product [Rotaria magnacalcarata]|uniref:HTH CENPB-type domain-containing protein n=1 Tax=Rotaria magnacalcarata TaxID=392030 RepID=A0A820K2V8_9BILA|nr:unnamed protein product [Rotaria magnacalcarata]CAF4335249.1 unnamed protein product [Rotaria magnacalcarata]
MKRHELTLDQKILLIKDSNDDSGLSVRKSAEKYSISKSSAANILTRRAEYQNDYLTNTNKGFKRKLKDDKGQHIDEVLFEWFTAQRAKHIPISGPLLQEKARQIDEVLFEWFTAQRAKHIPISGPLLQEKARQISEEFGLQPDEFKASNGWLENFRNGHMIGYRQISGESASVCTTTTEEWKHRLLTIINGYVE